MQNNELIISPHAERRMQQRAISLALVLVVLEYGKAAHFKDRVICHLHDRRAWQKVCRHLSDIGMPVDDHWRDAYIVVTEDWTTVITVGWHEERVKQGWKPKRPQKRGNRRKP